MNDGVHGWPYNERLRRASSRGGCRSSITQLIRTLGAITGQQTPEARTA